MSEEPKVADIRRWYFVTPHLLATTMPPISPPPPLHVAADVDLDLEDLLSSELNQQHPPNYLLRLQNRYFDPNSRLDAVKWIFKVGGFYSFQKVTAYLAVEYMDRFLSEKEEQEMPSEGWAWQLLAVASLSVAAKMKEREVPLLADLQVMDPKCAFEPRTVMRMELLLMAVLGWRMRLVTPFHYLHFLSHLVAGPALSPPLVSRASDLLLGTRRVVEFLAYRPSAVAVAAVTCAATEIGVFSDEAHNYFAKFPEAITKENAANGDCLKLMKARVVDEAPPIEPWSPSGVLDIVVAGGGCEIDDANTEIFPARERSCRLNFSICKEEGLYIVEDEESGYY